MNYHFCTCFDRNYLLAGWTLFRSLQRSLRHPFTLHVAALDDAVYELLSRCPEPDLRVYSLAEIESFDPDFARTRSQRSRVEYYFTLSPVLPRFLFARGPEIELLGYLDSDLFFFHDPEALFRELGERSLLLLPHRVPPELRWREECGVYNVAFQLYRRDPAGLAFLDWWRERCLDWCCDRVEPGRYADQKYLDQAPERFPELVVSTHPGADAAPWNWMTGHWTRTGGELRVDGRELLFYHFQGARFLLGPLYCTNLGSYGHTMPRWLLRELYGTYASAFRAARDELSRRFPEERFPLTMRHTRNGFSCGRALLSALYHRNLTWL